MTNDEKAKWFSRAVKFQLEGLIFLEMKSRKNGIGTWVIEDGKSKAFLNSNLEWEAETAQSQKDESFIIRTRFDLDTALALYEQYKMFNLDLQGIQEKAISAFA